MSTRLFPGFCRAVAFCVGSVVSGHGLIAAQTTAAQVHAAQTAESHAPGGPLWDSYSRAAHILEQALAAHGGSTAIRGLSQLSFRWDGEDYTPTQGRIPAWGTLENARVSTQDVRLDLSRNRFATQREFRFAGGYLNAFRQLGDGRELLTYNPHPDRGMAGRTQQRDTTGTAARRALAAAGNDMPLLHLRAALARTATLRHVGTTADDGVSEEAISYATVDGDIVTLYFDAATHLMTRRELMGLGSLGDEVNTYRFTDNRVRDGFTVPHGLEVRWNGLLAGRHRLTRFALSADLVDDWFQVPEGFTSPEPPAPPAVVRISEHHAFVEGVGGSYRMFVADTDDGLVVVDAPISEAVSEAAIRLIEAAFPDRPLRYVVITHHHSDHIGGIPAFASRGATILVAPGSADYIRQMSTVTRTIGRIGEPIPAPAEPTINTLTGRRTLGRGPRALDVIDVSPTSHAAAMLVVYVPSQRLLFQGDLLRVNQDGRPVVSPEATRDLDRIISRFRLRVETIGAVHGRNATMADLRAALEMSAAER